MLLLWCQLLVRCCFPTLFFKYTDKRSRWCWMMLKSTWQGVSHCRQTRGFTCCFSVSKLVLIDLINCMKSLNVTTKTADLRILLCLKLWTQGHIGKTISIHGLPRSSQTPSRPHYENGLRIIIPHSCWWCPRGWHSSTCGPTLTDKCFISYHPQLETIIIQHHQNIIFHENIETKRHQTFIFQTPDICHIYIYV